jgi:hypothetical protein
MKFAYADPPYPGMAHRYPEKTEVDHAQLIARLVADYPDGWALSTGGVNLREILPLTPMQTRVCPWVKTWVSFKPSVRVAYAWEPVLLCGGRPKQGRDDPTVVDWMACPIALRRGLFGAKPDQLFHWVLDLLGFRYGDTIDDLYPGTGRLSMILEARCKQTRIA